MLTMASGVVAPLVKESRCERERRKRAKRRAAEKRKSARMIQLVVERVASVRSVPAVAVVISGCECQRIAAARSLAMALCVEAGVPTFHVARAFQRNWATVYAARRYHNRRRSAHEAFRTEWHNLLKGLRR